MMDYLEVISLLELLFLPVWGMVAFFVVAKLVSYIDERFR